MNGLRSLIKKELREQLRTHKLLIIASVFTLFGLATPLLVKMLPQLVKLAGEEVSIQFPTPTAALAISEYADTLSQVGVLVAVLIAAGSVAREREQGTAALTLCKPVGRGAFLLSKLMAMSATFALSLLGAALAAYVYTLILFGAVGAVSFLVLNLLIALFLVFCLGVTLLCSTLFTNQLAAGGLALALLIGQAVASGLPWIGNYLPSAVVRLGLGLGQGQAVSAGPAVAVSLAAILASLSASWWLFRGKEL